MDVREKLVEILEEPCGGLYPACELADYLLDQGVTVQENMETIDELLKQLKKAPITTWKEEPSIEIVQEWISVKDRLPEYPGHYIVCTSINYWHGGCMDINENHKYHPSGTPVGYDGTTMSVIDCYYDVTGHWNKVCDSHVTHWMPIPKPPEGE